MKNTGYFVQIYADRVETLDVILDFSEENNGSEFEEFRRNVGGDMWCNEFEIIKSKGECGNACHLYHPLNGKWGRCRSLHNSFVSTGRMFKLIDGKMEYQRTNDKLTA